MQELVKWILRMHNKPLEHNYKSRIKGIWAFCRTLPLNSACIPVFIPAHFLGSMSNHGSCNHQFTIALPNKEEKEEKSYPI